MTLIWLVGAASVHGVAFFHGGAARNSVHFFAKVVAEFDEAFRRPERVPLDAPLSAAALPALRERNAETVAQKIKSSSLEVPGEMSISVLEISTVSLAD